MQVWIGGQFIAVEVQERQDGWNAWNYPVQFGERLEQVAVGKDVVARAEHYGHERDLYVLVARHAATAAAAGPGGHVGPIGEAELQALWTRAGQGHIEKVASGCLLLLVAALHRQRPLDVLGLAASLQRSVWEIQSALRVLYDYGAVILDGAQVPNPLDQSLHAARLGVRLAKTPPDLARLVEFAEALARTTDGIR